MTAGFNLFPFVVPSSTHPNQSLTVWNASSALYSLKAMLWVSIILFVIVFIYKMFAYFSIWHKKKTLSVSDIEANDHGYY